MKTFIYVIYICVTQMDCTYMVAPYEFLSSDSCMEYKDINDQRVLDIYKDNNINPNLFFSKCHELGTPLETKQSTLPLNRF